MEEYRDKTLRDYLSVLFRHKAVFISTVLSVMICVFIKLAFTTPLYEAQVKMLISAQKEVEAPYYREVSGGSELVLTQSEIVKSNAVLGIVVRALGLWQKPFDYEKRFASIFKKPFIDYKTGLLKKDFEKLSEEQKQLFLYKMAISDLKARLIATPLRNTQIFTISVTDYSAAGATIIANAVSRAYIIFDLQQQLSELQLKYGSKHPTAVQLKDSIDEMTKNLSGEPLPDFEAIGPASVKIIEQASMLSTKNISPNNTVIILFALAMSIFVAILLAFLFDYLSSTFNSPRDLEDVLNVPFLGSLPVNNGKADHYNELANKVFLMLKDRQLKSLMFASSLPREGTTKIITNVATHLSKTLGYKVLLIDSNFSYPSLQKLFKDTDAPGLVDVLEGVTTFDKAVRDTGNNLHVLTTGRPGVNSVNLLNSQVMHDLVNEAKERYDIVLVDSAALSNYNGGIIIGKYMDGAVIVVKEGLARRHAVKTLLSALRENKTNIFGAILNDRTFPIPKKIYNRL